MITKSDFKTLYHGVINMPSTEYDNLMGSLSRNETTNHQFVDNLTTKYTNKIILETFTGMRPILHGGAEEGENLEIETIKDTSSKKALAKLVKKVKKMIRSVKKREKKVKAGVKKNKKAARKNKNLKKKLQAKLKALKAKEKLNKAEKKRLNNKEKALKKVSKELGVQDKKIAGETDSLTRLIDDIASHDPTEDEVAAEVAKKYMTYN